MAHPLQTERRIVRKLIRYAKAAGWACEEVHDGEEYLKTPTEANALEVVFQCDQGTLQLSKDGAVHGVFCIGGNERDVISDWSYSEGDADGFNSMMEAFLDVLEAEED